MFLVVLVILVAMVVVSARDHSAESSPGEDESKLLAKSIRLKLMRDNYDYSHEEMNNTVTDNINKSRHMKKKTRKNFYVSDLAIDEKDNKVNTVLKANGNEKKHKKNIEHVVSKKDLLYYIDDEHIGTEKSVDTKSSVKYKFLKDRRQYRRSGQARLIQEENKEGVAIVNLDNGPFPELRLPNSRRQYMHDHGDAMADDEDVPPPTVNTSDPEAAADEIENQTETEANNINMTTNKY
ncbi:unnamed protein product [Euphydryas editha]|uniref:Uncharacterized protein n=1 Tax=Euphydryas editha TaxID=104508 RepID=A0AAU9UI39_EUPED|nr:unnamed protein product [Euphydryas editha]